MTLSESVNRPIVREPSIESWDNEGGAVAAAPAAPPPRPRQPLELERLPQMKRPFRQPLDTAEECLDRAAAALLQAAAMETPRGRQRLENKAESWTRRAGLLSGWR